MSFATQRPVTCESCGKSYKPFTSWDLYKCDSCMKRERNKIKRLKRLQDEYFRLSITKSQGSFREKELFDLLTEEGIDLSIPIVGIRSIK